MEQSSNKFIAFVAILALPLAAGAFALSWAPSNQFFDFAPVNNGYVVGSIAIEGLIAVKGYKTYMDFVSTFASATDWRAEFKRFYEITPDEFYLKLAPYLRGRLGS